MKSQLESPTVAGLRDARGERIIEKQARRQVRTFLDELRNGTTNYRTVASLGGQVAQEYRGRAVLELLQNAHDVLGGSDDPGQVSFVLASSPGSPELLIANSGRPFRREDFSGICELAQSPKDPNESVGNKGLGFRSVLELSTCPEVWSTAPSDGEPAFTFGFHPEVHEPIGRVAQSLFKDGSSTDPEFGEEPVVDWSERQIEEYRRRVSGNSESAAQVEKWLSQEVEYLSPYVIPRALGDPPHQVARLLEDGHVTVIRLPLDGGRVGSPKEAVNSVRDQLEALDEAAMVFLQHLSVLRTEVPGEVIELTRVESTQAMRKDGGRAVAGALHTQLRVVRTASNESETSERLFHVWSRIAGGEGQPKETERIKEAVQHLPNRWPEVRRVDVSAAVEDAREAPQGAFVIFLPTTIKTGLRAHVNAPFYGTLDRKKIDFGDKYNELLLEFLTDLMLDAVFELAEGGREPWRGRAVVDLLGQAGLPPSDDPELTRRLRERALDRDTIPSLEHLSLILCDGGWQRPGVARTMPKVPRDDPFGTVEWRKNAGFQVASSALDERCEAVEDLLRALGGSPDPTGEEWADTLEKMAEQVRRRRTASQADGARSAGAAPDWNMFLESVLAVLPMRLRSEPKRTEVDALTEAKFLPTEDGRLLAAGAAVRVFFQPRRDADDAAAFVGSVPDSLKERIAFLHRDVQTHEDSQRRRTELHKFLDGRFVQSFRRADLLGQVVVPSLPAPPALHRGPEAAACADALAWSLEVVGPEESESLLDDLAKLPVACIGGWFPMKEAVFGPGWTGRSGDHLKALADGLLGEKGDELMRRALLPPDDERWFPRGGNRDAGGSHLDRTDLADCADQFERAGVVDGLRLETCDAISFWMSKAAPKLPESTPTSVPQQAWDDWREAVRREIEPKHKGWFKYDLQNVKTVSSLHRNDIGNTARIALSNLILASLPHWKEGWDKVTIAKVKDQPFKQQTTSPLKHWLSTLPWLDDDSDEQALRGDPQPLHQRWLVPKSLLQGQSGRFRHLSPLSLQLARRLGEDEELLGALEGLGLNTYPTDDDRTGPALLEALADVAETLADGVGPTVHRAMPTGGFDVLLGQIRHAWKHLDKNPGGPLPTRFIVRTKPRTLTVRTADELKDVYLPDHGWQTRLLREHGQPIVAIRPEDAIGPMGDRLVELGARPAARLVEHCTIDGSRSAQAVEGTQTLAAAGLGWLPVVLLALHAHGGGNPAGPATKAWRRTFRRLRGIRLRQCLAIEVELRDSGQSVARSEPRAHWLSRERVLVVHRDIVQKAAFEQAAAACQAILDRQDLLKDLRLVLGALQGHPRPTSSQVEAALDRAEIDAVAAADIRLRWEGETRTLVHRIRPVLQLLDVCDDGLEAAATDAAGLTAWLAENAGAARWPTEELFAAAQDSYDDADMGYRAWRKLDDAAELPRWNEALKAVGDGYEQCRNEQAGAQARRCLSEAAPLLRAFARHVATRDTVAIKDQGALFERVVHLHERAESDREWRHHVAGWAERFWQVPFEAVLGVLRAGYDGIPEATEHLDLFPERVRNAHELRSALERLDADPDSDPREVARGNRARLDQLVRRVRECHAAWLVQPNAESTSRAESTSSEKDVHLFEASMYLRVWADEDLLRRATLAVADAAFRDAVGECATIEEVMDSLGITPLDLKKFRDHCAHVAAVKDQEKRTFEVAGEPFEIGGPVSYGELFARLKKLPGLPEQVEGIGSPPPELDGRGATRPGATRESELSRRGPRTGHLHGPSDLPELVGIVGEMHAFRFLQARFGIDTGAWVSESRTKVEPLLDSEEDLASDSLGYDFRFTHDRVTWCVEVKATKGDGTGFGLPTSELGAAARIAPRRNERWRILRVTKALTRKPRCYWLPNPFEPGPGERLRLRREGGATVEYSLPNSAKRDAQQPTRKGENG